MLKKLFLVLAISLTFAACNTEPETNNATPAKASPSPATAATPAPAATQTPAKTETPAATPSPSATASPAKPEDKPKEN